MRTTLQLDEDVLSAARALAERQGRTLGEVVSELARSRGRDKTQVTSAKCVLGPSHFFAYNLNPSAPGWPRPRPPLGINPKISSALKGLYQSFGL